MNVEVMTATRKQLRIFYETSDLAFMVEFVSLWIGFFCLGLSIHVSISKAGLAPIGGLFLVGAVGVSAALWCVHKHVGQVEIDLTQREIRLRGFGRYQTLSYCEVALIEVISSRPVSVIPEFPMNISGRCDVVIAAIDGRALVAHRSLELTSAVSAARRLGRILGVPTACANSVG